MSISYHCDKCGDTIDNHYAYAVDVSDVDDDENHNVAHVCMDCRDRLVAWCNERWGEGEKPAPRPTDTYNLPLVLQHIEEHRELYDHAPEETLRARFDAEVKIAAEQFAVFGTQGLLPKR